MDVHLVLQEIRKMSRYRYGLDVQTDRQAKFIYRLIKIFQNCFLGKIVAGVLGKPDPDFSSFQNLLAISELVHGWIKNRLCAETETYLTTCRKYKGRVLYGIKTPEE